MAGEDGKQENGERVVPGRTAFHVLFARLLIERGPKNFSFSFDVALTAEPQRADILIIRREPGAAPEEAHVLRRFWDVIRRVAVGEYKSPTRALRRGDLPRLLGYAAQWHAREAEQLERSTDLVMALFVPSWTPTLDAELACFGWQHRALGGGYYQVDSAPYALYIMVLDEVSEAENDGLLNLMGHRTIDSVEGSRWLLEHTSGSPEGPAMEKLEGYEELMTRAAAQMPLAVRLAGLTPEDRVAGLKPEERLSGLRPEDQILALSTEVLATLPTSFLETLPAPVREEIQRRLGTKH